MGKLYIIIVFLFVKIFQFANSFVLANMLGDKAGLEIMLVISIFLAIFFFATIWLKKRYPSIMHIV